MILPKSFAPSIQTLVIGAGIVVLFTSSAPQKWMSGEDEPRRAIHPPNCLVNMFMTLGHIEALRGVDMHNMHDSATKPLMTPTEARRVLGTTSKGMSDEAIRRLIGQVDVLTDIVVAHAQDSIFKSCIDVSKKEEHNNG